MNGGKWFQAEVAQHACDLFEPERPGEHGYVVLYLHGVHLRRLIDNDTFTGLFARHGLRVIAPRTGRSWWTDRICGEFDPHVTAEAYVLKHVVPYIAERWGAAPPRIALLGTSMGGQGALRLAFKHPSTFPIVAALSPAIDYQWRYDDEDQTYQTLREMYPDAEAARQDTATLHVHPLAWPRNIFFCCDPTDWPWIESSQKLQMKLAALGIPHHTDLQTVGGGHGFGYYNQMAEKGIEFIVRRLEQERLRIA
jgi:S-formylglutathione hydrolase FrmB